VGEPVVDAAATVALIITTPEPPLPGKVLPFDPPPPPPVLAVPAVAFCPLCDAIPAPPPPRPPATQGYELK